MVIARHIPGFPSRRRHKGEPERDAVPERPQEQVQERTPEASGESRETDEPQDEYHQSLDLSDLPCYVPGFDRGMNFRDLGGWPTIDGCVTKRGLIYRSARLCELDNAELVTLQKLGLSCVVDLRSSEEAAALPDPRFPSMMHLDVDAGRDEVSEEEARDLSVAGFIQLKAKLTCDMAFGNPAIRRIFDLLEEGNAPLLFHCNTGRDRSGVVAMIILMALGCPDDVLLSDYLLTNVYRAAALEYMEARYADALALGGEYRALVTLMAGVLPQVGQAILKAIDARYPSREAYLECEYDLGFDRLFALRARYTE